MTRRFRIGFHQESDAEPAASRPVQGSLFELDRTVSSVLASAPEGKGLVMGAWPRMPDIVTLDSEFSPTESSSGMCAHSPMVTSIC